MNDILIRSAVIEDAQAIMEIYQPYILETAITFEYDLISVETFVERIITVQKQFPWLVCELEGKVVGYAYCSKFKERAAFAWDCECSVYLHKEAQNRGIATALYTKLFKYIRKQGYYNIYALITYPNLGSEALHKKFGFTNVGIYEKTGYKMGQWWDLLVMVKRLRTFEEEPVLPKSWNELSDIE
ncbi:MAG: sortase-like acyltransferase [Herbinix sp.]|jgi:phosphinothricin acetyltransferase|nr:sortase-like acyltransferase [Herbinix sp.]